MQMDVPPYLFNQFACCFLDFSARSFPVFSHPDPYLPSYLSPSYLGFPPLMFNTALGHIPTEQKNDFPLLKVYPRGLVRIPLQ